MFRQWGDISSGASLGPHWDPHGHDHGCAEVGTFAYGDLGNWTAVAGVIDEKKNFSQLALSGNYSIIGRGVVLHANPDDCAVVTSAGARIAGGVIGIKNTGNTPNEALAAELAVPLRVVCTLKATTNANATTEPVNGAFEWTQDSVNGPVTASGTIGYAATVGVHVHAFGDVSDPAGSLTGGHFDPKNTGSHGLPTSTYDHHAGDMGNTDATKIGVDGKMWFHYTFDAGYINIFQSAGSSIIGRGFIVHSVRDAGNSDGSGMGARVAQCVIGIANTTSAVPTFPGYRANPVSPPPKSAAAVLSFSAVLALLFAALIALLH